MKQYYNLGDPLGMNTGYWVRLHELVGTLYEVCLDNKIKRILYELHSDIRVKIKKIMF
jgi:hypothetical protein